VDQDPSTSTRKIARTVGVSHVKVHKVLKENQLYPFHLTKVQDLKPADYQARINFCDFMLQKHRRDPDFFRSILWTDESIFTKDGVFNCRNSHHYDLCNPHQHVIKNSQHRFQIMVWAGLVGRTLVGPYFIEGGINGIYKYFYFLL
jgi:hypothetical protein